MTRLLVTAKAGENQMTLESGLDLTSGDRLALAPTGIVDTQSDYVIVDTYDSISGITTFDKPLSYTHFGDAKSTYDVYGIDMRGEVLILSKNIRISGDSSNSWGC